MKKLTIFGLSALFAAAATADTLYWVDSKTFNSTYNHDSARNLLNANKSTEEGNNNYNWATGSTVDENKVPTYTYADPVTAPTVDTDVYFDFSKNTGANQIAGTITLNANETFNAKNITITACNNNWAMFNLNSSSKIYVANNFTYNNSSWVRIQAGSVEIGGDVNHNATGYNNLLLGSSGNALTSFSVQNINMQKEGGILSLAVGRAATTYENARGVISGVLNFGANNAKVVFQKGGAWEQFIKIGGISGSTGTITTDATEGLNSTIVLTNAADKTFSGTVTNNLGTTTPVNTALNLIMAGTSTQKFSGENSFTGYVQMESGTLLLSTKSGKQHGKLTLNGGLFGAISNATVSSAEFNGGGFIFADKDKLAAGGAVDTVTIAGAFTKTGSDKIEVSFNGFDATTAIEEQYVYDLIFATSISGFASDANEDFFASNLDNALADFNWITDSVTGNKTLQVTFTQVPEPATIAALLGMAALAFAAYRRRK